ncbi:MAG: hypothetical protein EP343_28525 [Deltaproteobacteria bacterium]|nr:MAG: hypothetical protein EP343_28525 [Deltaproteobacteria bacterium]
MPLTCSLPPVEVKPDYQKDPTSWLPVPDQLVASCADWMNANTAPLFTDWFEKMGAPALDLQVTPLSTRVGCLALSQGQAFFHHETRGRIPMPEALAPERTVWDEGTLPVWQQGVLTEPKYFSFFLDTPLSPYNPNYRRKWRAHELLHGIVGFFWHPQMTRFEAYMGARLDELLPIVHWYGLDEAFRPRCSKHEGQQLYRDYCPECEALACPWSEHSPEWLEQKKPLAITWVNRAWHHFSEEWKACLQELNTGQTVEVARPHLNASSDAVGYLYSHWPRLTAWSFGSWVEHFLQDGTDYFSTLPHYMQRIADVSQQMVAGDCDMNEETYLRLRNRRAIQDLGYRAFLALEWLEEGTRAAMRAETALLPLMEEGGTLSQTLLNQEVPHEQCADWMNAVVTAVDTTIGNARNVPAEVTQSFAALGYSWWSDKEAESPLEAAMNEQAQAIVQEGLESGAPQGWERWQKHHNADELQGFLASTEFQQPGRLIQRFYAWYNAQPNADAETVEWFHFESWLHQEPLRDEAAERFAVLPDALTDLLQQKGTLRSHSTLRIERWSASLISEVLGETLEEPDASLAAIISNGEPRLMLLDDITSDCLTTVACLRPLPEEFLEQHTGALELLLQHSFVVWFPVPRT